MSYAKGVSERLTAPAPTQKKLHTYNFTFSKFSFTWKFSFLSLKIKYYNEYFLNNIYRYTIVYTL